MIRRSWRTQFKGTTSPQAVLTIVSQFMDEWTREEIAALPPGAWPPVLRTKADLLAHALRLGRMHFELEGASAGSLRGFHELLLFFTHAAVRATQLASLQDDLHGSPAPHPAKEPTDRREPESD